MTFLLLIFLFLIVPIANAEVSLNGSGLSLIFRNRVADLQDLTALRDETHVSKFRRLKLLIPLPENGFLKVDRRLGKELRYSRPWANDFFLEMTRIFFGIFRKPHIVTSAVRYIEYQEDLRMRNKNAAPARGPKASSHLRGATWDLAKAWMTPGELAWTRIYLLREEAKCRIDATEEWTQLVFDIMVFKKQAC
ncbi:hypothetical protein HYW53_03905 [Candidatus Giovannonibacteria bacterium]|nr:hypothetical protein [Candidatus Giovannonibacteria bacterium]